MKRLGFFCRWASSIGAAVLLASPEVSFAWKPADGPLKTPWTDKVSADKPHAEYPRPQLQRKLWQNLNGLWDLAITRTNASKPETFSRQILVPFPVESALSGVRTNVTPENRIWYRRTFQLPVTWPSSRVLLHFGAVDFEAIVWVNGKEVGQHRGGYDAFSFDITDVLQRQGENEIVVSVWDPTDRGTQPRGKQVLKPGGIMYTPTSGIWQTVWLEPVSSAYIKDLNVQTDIDRGVVTIKAEVPSLLGSYRVEATVLDRSGKVGSAEVASGQEMNISIKKPRLWSPEKPNLYRLVVTLKLGSGVTDRVESYFGMRKISLGKDDKGFTRIFLNNKPYFQFGPLDQGFWPDGLYTAPTDAALRFDIEMTKKLGYNMARKHVKVEPQRWYYWCDRLGLLVWQDMPSGDRGIRSNQPDITRTPESAAQFETELTEMIRELYNHPSIVMWVPFNEGWGQFDTARIVDLVRKQDPTRLVNNASGWTDRGVGDVFDAHIYPGPGAPRPESNRAGVLGEFGGLGLPVKGHTWQEERNWGYRSFTNRMALQNAYIGLAAKLFPLIEERGLSAAVYTQTTDVEVEVNGLLTYDRKVVKMNPKVLRRLNLGDVPTIPKGAEELVSTALSARPEWKYTLEKPSDDWMQPGFNDAGWKKGTAGFGTRGTPNAVVRTQWDGPEIWLRREFSLSAGTSGLKLKLHHDEDAEVYINGVLAARREGFTSDYEEIEIAPEARAALKPDGNILAVRCRQTRGGQYIDVGLSGMDKARR